MKSPAESGAELPGRQKETREFTSPLRKKKKKKKGKETALHNHFMTSCGRARGATRVIFGLFGWICGLNCNWANWSAHFSCERNCEKIDRLRQFDWQWVEWVHFEISPPHPQSSQFNFFAEIQKISMKSSNLPRATLNSVNKVFDLSNLTEMSSIDTENIGRIFPSEFSFARDREEFVENVCRVFQNELERYSICITGATRDPEIDISSCQFVQVFS